MSFDVWNMSTSLNKRDIVKWSRFCRKCNILLQNPPEGPLLIPNTQNVLNSAVWTLLYTKIVKGPTFGTVEWTFRTIL